MGNGNGARWDRSQPGGLAECAWPNASVRAEEAESVAWAPVYAQSGRLYDLSVALESVKARVEIMGT